MTQGTATAIALERDLLVEYLGPAAALGKTWRTPTWTWSGLRLASRTGADSPSQFALALARRFTNRTGPLRAGEELAERVLPSYLAPVVTGCRHGTRVTGPLFAAGGTVRGPGPHRSARRRGRRPKMRAKAFINFYAILLTTADIRPNRAERAGMSSSELRETLVPTIGLDHNRSRAIAVGDATARFEVVAPGRGSRR